MSFGGLPLTFLTVPLRKKANLSYRVHVLWRLAFYVLDCAVKKKGKSVISGACPLEACPGAVPLGNKRLDMTSFLTGPLRKVSALVPHGSSGDHSRGFPI